MKIGILTYHRTYNYGGCLQALATRLVLEEMGHEVFYIDFSDDPIIEVYSLEDKGYDLNDDGSVYRDSNGRPINTSKDNHCHLVENIITHDETGKRVLNVEYINELISRHFGPK